MKTFQNEFHSEWHQLKDKHVRSLAWMLTAPDLLEKNSAIWWQQIGEMAIPNRPKLHKWLHALDEHPTALHEMLKLHQFTRIGHYAERLLAFYFQHEGLLYGHGIQVFNDRYETIGEFDYLLYAQGGLAHLELATKFYLFYQADGNKRSESVFDYIGPNLTDTLGAKMQKILQKQLTLSSNEYSKKIVQTKIVSARAIIKGWLFYRSQHDKSLIPGVAVDHCMGFWWTLEEFERLAVPYGLKLERLEWLAPAQTALDEVMDKGMLLEAMHR
ncbi:MAG: DUF1853 family protein, partial [Undibacterium sp.]|nr:DUF1853 family protein [Undibacterium sp.]